MVLLDVFALLMLLKAASCFIKTKKKALYFNMISLSMPIGALVYIVLVDGDINKWTILLYFISLFFINVVYSLFPVKNNIYTSVAFGIILSVIGVYVNYNIFHNYDIFTNLLYALISFSYVFALDCSDMKGYSTLNVFESILLFIVFLKCRLIFSLIMAGIYFIVSSVAYIKFNKLEALSGKSKLNREQRRQQEKMKRKR